MNAKMNINLNTISFNSTTNILTIPRSCFPPSNPLLSIAVIGTLSLDGDKEENTEEYMSFCIFPEITFHLIKLICHRWGFNIYGMRECSNN